MYHFLLIAVFQECDFLNFLPKQLLTLANFERAVLATFKSLSTPRGALTPLSIDPLYIVTMLYKMGHYFLDTQ